MDSSITRREMLQQSAAIVGALALGATSATAFTQKRPKVLLSCETYSVRDLFGNGKLTLEQVPALYKQLDIKGISWNDMFFKSWETSYLDALNKAMKENDCISTCFIMEGNLASNDEGERKRQIEENTRKLKIAAYLGAPTVRMNLGGTGADATDDTVGVERCIAAFEQMLPLAKQLKIKITIENHGGCSATADRILKIIKGSDPKWVGSCLDFGNWPGGEKRYEETAKLAAYAYHVHAKTHRFGADGEELDVDYGRCLEMMRKVKYQGAVSIEWEGSEPKDQIEGVKLTRDLVRKHWKGI